MIRAFAELATSECQPALAYQNTRNQVIVKNSVSLSLHQHEDLFLSGEGCYNDAFGCEIFYKNVNLAPNAETRQVDSRFNREADAGDQSTFISRFQIVDIDAVAMYLRAEAVPGPVD